MTDIDFSPRVLRVFAAIVYAIAALTIGTALLGLAQVLLTNAGPDWNIAARFADGCAWFYVGALHSTIARLRESA